MARVYKMEKWKKFANWAPQDSIEYRILLQQKTANWFA
jgi:hypothetical protein